MSPSTDMTWIDISSHFFRILSLDFALSWSWRPCTKCSRSTDRVLTYNAILRWNNSAWNRLTRHNVRVIWAFNGCSCPDLPDPHFSLMGRIYMGGREFSYLIFAFSRCINGVREQCIRATFEDFSASAGSWVDVTIFRHKSSHITSYSLRYIQPWKPYMDISSCILNGGFGTILEGLTNVWVPRYIPPQRAGSTTVYPHSDSRQLAIWISSSWYSRFWGFVYRPWAVFKINFWAFPLLRLGTAYHNQGYISGAPL